MALAMASQASAQNLPDSFNYQAMINADDGSPISNKDITVEVSILQGNGCDNNPDGCAILWQELHTPKTNDFGLFSVEIGSKDAISTMTGSKKQYSDIEWVNVSGGYYYLKVRVDFGEAAYLNGMTDLGTTKFSAVPYTLAAQTAENAKTASTLKTDNDGKSLLNASQLADMKIVNPQKSQILVYDGSAWKNADPANSQGLTNIDIQNPSNGDLLRYNSTSKNWENKPFPAINIENLANVNVEALNKMDVIAYSGTNWQNTPFSLNMLSNVNGTPTTGQVLTYNGSSWAPADAAGGGAKTESIYELTKDVKIAKASLADGQVLAFNYANSAWENRDNENIWQKDIKTKTYYTSTKIGVGQAVNPDENGANVLLKVAPSASSTGTTLLTGKGLTIGCSKDRIKGNGCIVLGTIKGTNDIQASSCIAGNNTFIDELANNSIVMGDMSENGAFNSIVVGEDCKGRGQNVAVFGKGTQSAGDYSLTIGQYNKYATDQLFAIGNGANKTDKAATIFYIKNDNDIYYSGELKGSSDQRLKTNITTMDGALASVMRMRGVTFYWDKSMRPNSSSELQNGFIAQEIEKIFPNLVATDVNGYKTVNYIGVIPVLTEAIKEQQGQIETLKKENEELKTTLDALLKRVEALENK